MKQYDVAILFLRASVPLSDVPLFFLLDICFPQREKARRTMGKEAAKTKEEMQAIARKNEIARIKKVTETINCIHYPRDADALSVPPG